MDSLKNIISDSDVTLERIVTESIKNNINKILPKPKKQATKPVVEESFVAQPKHYGQVTDYVGQKTKDQHDELYKNYIKTFDRVSAELDSTDRKNVNSNHSEYRAAKIDESANLNAVWLHELFFANCFDPNSEIYMDDIAFLKIQQAYGTFDAWQEDFIACAKACGQGWAVLGYNTYLKAYVNTFVSENSQNVMMGVYPIMVIDMFEHARRDYFNDKESYIVAMLKEINWDVINDRVKRAEAIGQVIK